MNSNIIKNENKLQIIQNKLDKFVYYFHHKFVDNIDNNLDNIRNIDKNIDKINNNKKYLFELLTQFTSSKLNDKL